MSFPDQRRKLSSRDYLLIQLARKTHSLRELSKIFGVHRNWIRRILTNPKLRCPICHEWKPESEGVVLKNQDNPKQFLWICSTCLAVECA